MDIELLKTQPALPNEASNEELRGKYEADR